MKDTKQKLDELRYHFLLMRAQEGCWLASFPIVDIAAGIIAFLEDRHMQIIQGHTDTIFREHIALQKLPNAVSLSPSGEITNVIVRGNLPGGFMNALTIIFENRKSTRELL